MRDWTAVKSTFVEHGFSTLHTHGGSKRETPSSGDLMPFDFSRHQATHRRYTYIHAYKHRCKQKIKITKYQKNIEVGKLISND